MTSGTQTEARSRLPRLAACGLLAACAASPPPTTPESFYAEEWNACRHVFTEADTKALHDAAQALAPGAACSFDGVYVRGWQAVIAFASPRGKAEAMLQPSQCVSEPPPGSVVSSAYTLTQAEGAVELCPEAMSALVAAVREGKLPPPTKVEPEALPVPSETPAVEAPDAGTTPAAPTPEAPGT